jgi:sirohydrochlorin cobaltochelatase
VAETHARAIRARGVFAAVESCCLEGRPSLAEALARIDDAPVYLVPMLMAEGFTARTLLPRRITEAGARGRVVTCRAVGANPGLAALVERQAVASCEARGWSPAQTALVVIGHGTPRDEASGATLLEQADRLAGVGAFAEVLPAFLEQAPRASEVLARLAGRRAVAVGFFADHGAHSEGEVSGMIARAGPALAYAGAVGVLPEVADLIVAQARAAGA